MGRKTIKRRTYANMMCVINALEKEKGYDFETAHKIANNLFDNLEANPNGLGIWHDFERVLSATEYERAKLADYIATNVERGLVSLREAIEYALMH